MTTFGPDDDLRGATFERVRLHGATFRESNFSEATFYDVSFQGATLREAWFAEARLRGVSFEDASIEGDVEGLVINGVEIAPLIEAELDRRHPGRAQLRSSDPDELRAAWGWLESLWAETTAAALAHPESSLRLSVDDEWSFLQTLRHLLFATDSWLGAAILGRTTYHRLGLGGPWLDPTTVGHDVDADPTVEEVLAARAAQQAVVRDYLATVTADQLAATTVPPEGAGWPPPHPMTALARLHVILIEEWWHRQFAVRDMAQWPPS
jgi:hypothetical protein